MTEYPRAHDKAYRADIDGLRAIAIVPVVLYHAGIAPFAGGYIGVDVFFVISGYLITGFILRQIERDEFSLVNFYLRRIRRIFPALFVMMAVCAAVGWKLLTPQDYRLLGESILATALFSSNVLFWLTSGYFGVPLEQQPLLHTWSLGVEEQFYLVFPIFLALLCRFFKRKLIAITFGLCVLSFSLNVFTVSNHPSFAFFLAPPRIWELFLGALLAMGVLGSPRGVKSSEVAGFIGVALIGYGVFGFSNDTRFPGVAALVPTIGAAVIIWAGVGRNAIMTRVLSHPFPVLIGKISYSLYLWHFPLLAFGAYVFVGTPSLVVRSLLLAFSTVLALISWIYIEQPVRHGYRVFGKTRAVFGMATAALVLYAGFGLLSYVTGGFPGRISEPSLQIAASERDFNPDRGLCLRTARNMARRPPCRFGIDDAVPEFALWGDSHAESLRAGIDSAAKKARRAGIFLGGAGCIPELGIERGNQGCDVLNEAIIAYVLSVPSIHTVILAGRWGLWAEGMPIRREVGTKRVFLVTQSGLLMDNHKALSTGLENAVARLTGSGKQVWLVGPIPEIAYDVPRTLYLHSLGIPERVEIRPTLKEFKERQAFVLRKFSELIEEYNVKVVWPHRYLCDSEFCQVQKNGRPLYIDDHHLTRSAALSMSEVFDPIFADRAVPDRTIVETR